MSPKFMGFIIIHYSKIFKFSYVRINVHSEIRRTRPHTNVDLSIELDLVSRPKIVAIKSIIFEISTSCWSR